jgi:hypothetical protein
MNNLRNILIGLDYFGQPVRLTFNGSKKFSTEIGGLLTISIFCVILVLIIQQGGDLLKHLKPKVNVMDLYLLDQPIIEISDTNIMFSVQLLTNTFQPSSDASYFTMQLEQFVVERNEKGSFFNTYPIHLESCSLHIDSFFKQGNFSQELLDNHIPDSLCLKNHTGRIGGKFTSNYFSNLKFTIMKCNNQTTKVPCKSPQEINEFLNGAYFEFYYIDKYINSENFTHPFQYFLNTYFLPLDPFSYKFVDLYLKTANISTDQGFLFQDNYVTSEIMFDYYREQLSVYKSGTTVIDFYVNSSFNFLNMNRNYMKIQDLAAATGGILKVFLVIGLVISRYFNDYKMLENILNTLYNFQMGNDSQTGKDSDDDLNNNRLINLNKKKADESTMVKELQKYALNKVVDVNDDNDKKSNFKRNNDISGKVLY